MTNQLHERLTQIKERLVASGSKLTAIYFVGTLLVAVILGLLISIQNAPIQPGIDFSQGVVQYTNILGENYSISVAIADTSQAQAQGLQNVLQMPSDSGMFFIFANEQPLQFWMKDTYIPLDIIFLDNNLRVVTIHKYTKTNQIEERYPSTQPARYVLEVNAGWSDTVGLRLGDTVGFSRASE